jgi:hypothetical protein
MYIMDVDDGAKDIASRTVDWVLTKWDPRVWVRRWLVLSGALLVAAIVVASLSREYDLLLAPCVVLLLIAHVAVTGACWLIYTASHYQQQQQQRKASGGSSSGGIALCSVVISAGLLAVLVWLVARNSSRRASQLAFRMHGGPLLMSVTFEWET